MFICNFNCTPYDLHWPFTFPCRVQDVLKNLCFRWFRLSFQCSQKRPTVFFSGQITGGNVTSMVFKPHWVLPSLYYFMFFRVKHNFVFDGNIIVFEHVQAPHLAIKSNHIGNSMEYKSNICNVSEAKIDPPFPSLQFLWFGFTPSRYGCFSLLWRFEVFADFHSIN